jgi:subtilisin family serine protease
MNKLISFLVGLVMVGSMSPALAQEGSRKIVVFRQSLNEAARDVLISRHGAVKYKDLSLINGSAVWLPNKAAEKALESHPGVLRLDDDVVVYALMPKTGDSGSSQPAQTIPWGIDRVDAELVWPLGNNADPVKLAIIDTGISKDHPDLKENIKSGYNAINSLKSWNDDNGHGSHVAGIAGALNNSIGVVGMGPLVDLYAVKVLNRNGSGFISDVIEGIQWSVVNGMKVINMSLGTSSDVQSLHDAVIAAKNAGVTLVAAAGNSGGAVIFPAAYPEVIAVAAADQNNNLASFSSRGPEVDLAAPGVSIYSTYKGTNYATLSGTSMASPHVAGAAALVLNTSVGTYDANGDGVWNPDEVQKKLQDRAVPTSFGVGLLNAYQAVQP